MKDAVARRLALIDTRTAAQPNANGSYTESLLVSEIDSLREVIVSFTRWLNQVRSPILRLPPEVIRLIFNTVVQSLYSDNIYVERKPKVWLRIGHVCSRFRAIILGMHTLWADIVFCLALERHSVHEELLQRAHDAPLLVNFMDYGHSVTAVELAARHLTRSHIILAAKPEAAGSFAPRLRSGSFLYLRQIDLRSYWRSDYPATRRLTEAEEGLYLTTDAYHSSAANMPNLRDLTLINIFIPFDASTLTELFLRRPADTTTPDMLPPDPFLDMLRRCINVKDLCLEEWIPDLPITVTHDIELPALKKITLTGNRSHVLRLWALLRIPALAIVEVAWAEDSGFRGQIESTSVFLAHVRAYNGKRPLSRIEVSGWEDEGLLCLCLYSLCEDRDGPYTCCTHPRSQPFWNKVFKIDLSSSFETAWTASDMAEAIERFCAIYGFLTFTTLQVNCDILRIDPDVFRHFPSVQSLYLRWPDADMIGALSNPPSDSHSPSAILYPNLHTLSISTMDSLDEGEQTALSELLSVRAVLSVPIQVLDLDCRPQDDTGDWEYLRKFEDMVPTLYGIDEPE